MVNRDPVAKALSDQALMKMKGQIQRAVRGSPNRSALAYNLGKDFLIALQYLPAVFNKVNPMAQSQEPAFNYPGNPNQPSHKSHILQTSTTNEPQNPSPIKSKVTAKEIPRVLTPTSPPPILVSLEDEKISSSVIPSVPPSTSSYPSPTSILNSITSTFSYTSTATATSPAPVPVTPELKFDRITVGQPISQDNVDIRTKYLTSVLNRNVDTSTPHGIVNHLETLFTHINQHPESIPVALENGVIKSLGKLLRLYPDEVFVTNRAREILAAVGFNPPVKGPGIKVLSIDGGGVRGLVAIEVLRQLERATNKRIPELFDFICGVSTGSILAFLLGAHHRTLDECEALYKELSREVFNQNSIIGAGSLMWSHAYYHTPTWEKILKKHIGEMSLLTLARDPKSPRVAAISAIVNHERIIPYVFRTYGISPTGSRVKSVRYMGGFQHDMWEAVRASAAAPTYFEEMKLGNYLHQDGGILVNNPTSVALSEAKTIWSGVPLHCVVSLGTGLTFSSHDDTNLVNPISAPEPKVAQSSSSWKSKFLKVLDSATDTEAIHYTLNELLPRDVYFRFNPYLSEVVGLDEGNPEKLYQLQEETRDYLGRNSERVDYVGKILLKEKGIAKKVTDWWNY